MKPRHQRGYLYRKSGCWYLRYYDTDASGTRVQKARQLARIAGEFKTKTAARALADEFICTVNAGESLSAITLGQFVTATYLPAVERQKRVSTFRGYRNLWKRYLVQDVQHVQLRNFHTRDGERILGAIAQRCDLNVTTLRHIKAFLSGVFRHAKRQGLTTSDNPMREAAIPRGRPPKETHAYSLEEIGRMLELLPEPAATIVAAAAFTGARKGELRGFSWEDYDGREIKIARAWWRNTVDAPKTEKSKAPVPVIPQLAARLNLRRDQVGNPTSGLMFPALCNKAPEYAISGPVYARPLNLDTLARDVIAPALRSHGIEWNGWHAFRRGLATNLHHLGVQDKVIQRILRHSNVAVTQACYIKTAEADVERAMEQLSAASSQGV